MSASVLQNIDNDVDIAVFRQWYRYHIEIEKNVTSKHHYSWATSLESIIQ